MAFSFRFFMRVVSLKIFLFFMVSNNHLIGGKLWSRSGNSLSDADSSSSDTGSPIQCSEENSPYKSGFSPLELSPLRNSGFLSTESSPFGKTSYSFTHNKSPEFSPEKNTQNNTSEFTDDFEFEALTTYNFSSIYDQYKLWLPDAPVITNSLDLDNKNDENSSPHRENKFIKKESFFVIDRELVEKQAVLMKDCFERSISPTEIEKKYRQLFDHAENNKNKEFFKLEIDFMHILYPLVLIKKCDSGDTYKGKLQGFHYDCGKRLLNQGLYRLENIKSVDNEGSYRASVIMFNTNLEEKTFFPAHWDNVTIVEKIVEALGAPVYSSVRDTDNKIRVIGKTKGQMFIEFFIAANGSIETVYPLSSEDMAKALEELQSSKSCSAVVGKNVGKKLF